MDKQLQTVAITSSSRPRLVRRPLAEVVQEAADLHGAALKAAAIEAKKAKAIAANAADIKTTSIFARRLLAQSLGLQAQIEQGQLDLRAEQRRAFQPGRVGRVDWILNGLKVLGDRAQDLAGQRAAVNARLQALQAEREYLLR